MNEPATPPTNSPSAPPVIPDVPAASPLLPPPPSVPINGLGGAIQALLREPRCVMAQLGQAKSASLSLTLFLIAAVCSLIYGLVTGTFSGGDQLWAAPVKIAGGLLISGLICLPSLYIFSCLSGSRAGLGEIFGLVAGLLALTAVLLIGFAPVAWVFSQSTESVAMMGALHLLFGLVSVGFGLRFLHNAFAQVQGQSKSGLVIWTFIFLLVALQMTTALRPIVGKADTFFPTEKKFFLQHWADCVDKATGKSSNYEKR
ncbi:MAG: hypothetical protein HZA90_05455 [Verrucomicrobia bacterium]|nr:hypothetical protein [Verrucomicrobiota bacterium]